MDTTLFYILNNTGIENEIRNYCERNFGTDGYLNFTLAVFLFPQDLNLSTTCLAAAEGHASATCQARELKLLSVNLQVRPKALAIID